MNTLLIFYDLAGPEQNREALISKIKAYGKWARLGDSAYMILTDQPPVTVRDGLTSTINPNDRIFIGVSPAPAAWLGLPEAVSKWIIENQK